MGTAPGEACRGGELQGGSGGSGGGGGEPLPVRPRVRRRMRGIAAAPLSEKENGRDCCCAPE
eukprot:10413-Chlamydomonas_euryale.AAC.1